VRVSEMLLQNFMSFNGNMHSVAVDRVYPFVLLIFIGVYCRQRDIMHILPFPILSCS
jgi:hypothetical protein